MQAVEAGRFEGEKNAALILMAMMIPPKVVNKCPICARTYTLAIHPRALWINALQSVCDPAHTTQSKRQSGYFRGT